MGFIKVKYKRKGKKKGGRERYLYTYATVNDVSYYSSKLKLRMNNCGLTILPLNLFPTQSLRAFLRLLYV